MTNSKVHRSLTIGHKHSLSVQGVIRWNRRPQNPAHPPDVPRYVASRTGRLCRPDEGDALDPRVKVDHLGDGMHKINQRGRDGQTADGQGPCPSGGPAEGEECGLGAGVPECRSAGVWSWIWSATLQRGRGLAVRAWLAARA